MQAVPTLDEIKATQTKLAQMISTFEANAPTVLTLPEFTIELLRGERYAGLILGDDGKPSHHLILLPGDECANWEDAEKLSANAGGELPTRQEQSLLFANLKSEFKADWYWSGTEYSEILAYAQDFLYGTQINNDKFGERRCRFVRRLVL